MDLKEQLLDAAARKRRRIVLSEGEDPRVIEAALQIQNLGTATPVLIGNPGVIAGKLEGMNMDRSPLPEIIDPSDNPEFDSYAELFLDVRKSKSPSAETSAKAARTPHTLAALMVRAGKADGTVGGAVLPTAEIVRTAFQIIGPATGGGMVSSFFLMFLDASHHHGRGTVVFADCAIVIEPSAEELARIAMDSADSFSVMTGDTPKVAMLSFSTNGSARHKSVSKVSDATGIARSLRPDLIIDGELQFDTAFVPEIGSSKAPGSPLAGDANVFIFPNLDSGNIGYKIAQRIGSATAVGPVLQGLAQPANDLSRGCSVEDIVLLTAVTALQARDT